MKFQSYSKISGFWRYGNYLIALLAVAPLVSLIAAWGEPLSPHWQHLLHETMPRILMNSLLLLLGVVITSGVLGVGSAWLVTMYPVPGGKWLRGALILPMAIPAYVNGFINISFWDYSGPFHSFLRSIGIQNPILDIRSLPGAVWILSLSLYPYVYFMSRMAFESQGGRLMEAGQALGLASHRVFWKLALPMARPWIVGSLILVSMETLAEFGTVSIFGVDTFTTAIYKAWFGFFAPNLAAQLATCLLMVVLIVALVDRKTRGERTYQQFSGRLQTLSFRRAWQRYVAAGLLWSLLAVAFLLPLMQLCLWGGRYMRQDGLALLTITMNSTVLGLLVAATVTLLSLALIFGLRFFPSKPMALANYLSVLGYAIPGVVLAVGVYRPLLVLDNVLADASYDLTGYDPGLLLTGGLVTMVLGLTLRFMAVGHGALKAAQERISLRIDEAASNFGVYGMRQLRRIHLPIIGPSVTGALILVFIDTVKEMPLTLMTRPLGWDTLSVRLFEFISEGEWERAALPSLVLVALGLIPVYFLKKEDHSCRG